MEEITHENQGQSTKQEVMDHNCKTDSFGDIAAILKGPSVVNKLPFVIDVLTDAKALLDYNDQMNRNRNLAKEKVLIDLCGSSCPSYINKTEKLQHASLCALPLPCNHYTVKSEKLQECNLVHQCHHTLTPIHKCTFKQIAWVNHPFSSETKTHSTNPRPGVYGVSIYLHYSKD